MAKREFLMLSQTYDSEKNQCFGWFASTKLDGQRIFWDGGASRGLHVKDVPYANTTKDYIRIDQDIRATGLWSRNGKVIRAPEFWLDQLPKGILLDGEAYSGPKSWEFISATVKDLVPNENDWKKIKFHVFDSPPIDKIFADGVIGSVNDIFCKAFRGCIDWVNNHLTRYSSSFNGPKEFEYIYHWLKKIGIENEVVSIVKQERLPFEQKAMEVWINNRMTEIIASGGEGIMLRRPSSLWTPERSYNLLKVKRWEDSEAIVKGYIWGRKTNRGSKLLGLMGTMEVEWEGKLFEISGFNWEERKLVFAPEHPDAGKSAAIIGEKFPGERVHGEIINYEFPIGSKITFRYRELSAMGVPKHAQYFRRTVDL